MALDSLKNESLRIFLALPLAPLFQSHVEPLISQGKKKFPFLRWVDPAEIHLTLYFFGSVDLKSIEEIGREIKPIASETKVFTIYLSELGGFPNLKRPRVIWLGMRGEIDCLKSLHSKIEARLKRIGFPSEKREFKPHLTIARIKVSGGDLDLEASMFKDTPSKTVKEIVLFQSHLGAQGVHYEALKTFSFSNSQT